MPTQAQSPSSSLLPRGVRLWGWVFLNYHPITHSTQSTLGLTLVWDMLWVCTNMSSLEPTIIMSHRE
jgi:hypothetical protein